MRIEFRVWGLLVLHIGMLLNVRRIILWNGSSV
jgi:hypothetical protein